MATSESLKEKARKIRMVLLDVDGVMTNGQVFFMPGGEEIKTFFITDGFGIVAAMKAGIRIGIISGRASASLQQRCAELHIEDLYMGTMEKLPVLEKIASRHGYRYEEIAFMGDDIPDLPVLLRVGLSATPENGHPQVKSRVDMVVTRRGGEGAVRELIDFLLKAQGKEDELLRHYTA
jgi:3-deoxy-D-manno-octulosonate 8-phosphate phosphatase (KDO 8-P phosphatase)